MLSVELNFVSRERRVLGGDGYYDWVDIKHFTVRPSAGPADSALDSLTKHVRFRDNYAEKGSYERDSVEIHGPYKLASISPASFGPVSAEAARETLRWFVMLYGTPAEHADRLHVMEAVTSATLTAADEIYRLGVPAKPHCTTTGVGSCATSQNSWRSIAQRAGSASLLPRRTDVHFWQGREAEMLAVCGLRRPGATPMRSVAWHRKRQRPLTEFWRLGTVAGRRKRVGP
jgi:hypothetical protein